MMQRFARLTMALPPLGGLEVNLPGPARVVLCGRSLQELLEKVVVAVPTPLSVQRHREQVAALKVVENLPVPGARSSEQYVCQWEAEACDRRRGQHETLYFRCLAGEGFLREVVIDLTAGPGECSQRVRGRRRALCHGGMDRQHYARWPALCLRGDNVERRIRESESMQVNQEGP